MPSADEGGVYDMKKAVSIILTMILLAQILPGTAMAAVKAGGEITVESKNISAGTEEFTIGVELRANRGISNMRLQLQYPDGFSLERIEQGDALSGLTFTPPGNLTANPVNLVWDGVDADQTNGPILWLTFRISREMKPGSYPVTLSCRQGDVLDGDLEDVSLQIAAGTIQIQDLTVIVPATGGAAPIYTISGKTVTVSGEYACAAAYKNADGSYTRLKPTAQESRKYRYTVPDGVTEITLVIKGDLNSDGKLTVMEARQALKAVTDPSSLTGLEYLCADLNGDGAVSVVEARTLLRAVTDKTAIQW